MAVVSGFRSIKPRNMLRVFSPVVIISPNDSTAGTRSNIDTQKGQAATIDRIDVNGNNKPVRFDKVDSNVMIDIKISERRL